MEKSKVECKVRIRQGLELRKMTQQELSNITGLDKSAISCYLSGKYIPAQMSTYKIAKALDVSEAWLMGFDVPMERIQYVEASLTPEEKSLIDKFKKLTANQKHELTNYLDFLLTQN